MPEVREYGGQAGDFALLRSAAQILLGGGADFQDRRWRQKGCGVYSGGGWEANDESAAFANLALLEGQ